VEDRPLDESALVERAKLGDTRAYEALIALHADVAFRTAYLIARNEADAADAVNEAFFRAFTALRRFRSGLPFRPWILRIVANAAKDRRATAARSVRLAVRLSEHAVARSASSAESVVTALESRDEVVAAVARLRERDRLVIAYRYFLDLSEEEMAAVLDCPRGTVKSRLSRALESLRLELETVP
jgi:RNA polymerase sigma-70 factor (ECF subfamily)